jgi:hypothetical protein
MKIKKSLLRKIIKEEIDSNEMINFKNPKPKKIGKQIYWSVVNYTGYKVEKAVFNLYNYNRSKKAIKTISTQFTGFENLLKQAKENFKKFNANTIDIIDPDTGLLLAQLSYEKPTDDTDYDVSKVSL